MMDEITLIMLASQLLLHAKNASPHNLVTLFISSPLALHNQKNQRALGLEGAPVIPTGRITLKSHTY